MFKRFLLITLSIILMLLLMAGCSTDPQYEPGSVEETESKAGNETIGMDISQDLPCIERYAFTSWADFKTFCETGSTDVMLYKEPPVDGIFPPYTMRENAFVDVFSLFPSLDADAVTLHHIEIASDARYTIMGYTNDDKVPFSISVRYNPGVSYKTPEEFALAANSSSLTHTVYGDFCKATDEQKTAQKFMLFAAEVNDCMIRYSVSKGQSDGMAMSVGDYVIGVSPTSSNNPAFFADETLSALNCLFTDGPQRDAAMKNIKDHIDGRSS